MDLFPPYHHPQQEDDNWPICCSYACLFFLMDKSVGKINIGAPWCTCSHPLAFKRQIPLITNEKNSIKNKYNIWFHFNTPLILNE